MVVGAFVTALPHFVVDTRSYDVNMSVFFVLANLFQQGFDPEPQRG